MTYDLIIFDCDGTLVDTEYPVNEAFLAKLREYAPSEYQKFDVPYILDRCIGATVDGIFIQMAKDVSNVISDTNKQKIIAEYQDIVPDYLKDHLTPDPELIAILRTLSTQFKTCVASNGKTRNVVNSLIVAGLSDIFKENVFTAENVVNPKPAPDLILYAANQLGISDMSRVLHIEDAARGARAGIAAGANVIGYTGHAKDKAQTAAELKDAGVIAVFDNWADIKTFALK